MTTFQNMSYDKSWGYTKQGFFRTYPSVPPTEASKKTLLEVSDRSIAGELVTFRHT